jgi:N-acetyl-gamma-glutamyl-phosphate reductase
MIKVGIIGANGYLGLELLRILKAHSKVEISKIFKRESLIEDEFTHLSGLSLNNCLTSNLSDFIELDCVFLSLPHGHSYKYVKELLGKTKIIDLSADSRITDKSLYSQYYFNDMDSNIQKHFIYGFIERDREMIKKANNIANPGCFALCTQLALLPFNEIINSASITAITGSSGGGKEPSPKNHHSKRSKDMFSYDINSHRHLAEIYQSFPHLSEEISFVPTSGPFVRGIFLTAHINLKQNYSNDDLLNLVRSKFNAETFVRIQDQVNLSNIIGSNFCDISMKQTSPSSIVIQSSLDNLMKGASGNAVECFNLMHNLPYNEGVGSLMPFYL